TLGRKHEINHCDIDGAIERPHPLEILLVFLRRDKRLCTNLVSSSFQSFQVAIPVEVMIPKLHRSCHRNVPPFQITPKGLRIANSAERKEGTAAYFAEIAWG